MAPAVAESWNGATGRKDVCAIEVNWPTALPGRTRHVITPREAEHTRHGKHIVVCIFWLRISELIDCGRQCSCLFP